MGVLESTFLGIVQGITEFLPISSSGHLIIARKFLGLTLENSLSFDVLLHFATLLVIIFYFWKDLIIITKNQALALVIGSIPAGVLGFFLSDKIENYFREPHLVAYALILGSILFFIADKIYKPKNELSKINTERAPKIGRSFLIGLFQSLALISGFSRSGSTISGGLILGLSREEAIRFAFLLGIPITAGAILKTFLDLPSSNLLSGLLNIPTLFGFLAALISGFFAVRFLVHYLSSHNFTPFIIYRLLLAIIILIFL